LAIERGKTAYHRRKKEIEETQPVVSHQAVVEVIQKAKTQTKVTSHGEYLSFG
jgi:hypothetical protein